MSVKQLQSLAENKLKIKGRKTESIEARNTL